LDLRHKTSPSFYPHPRRESNDPAYILNLLKRVIRVSMDTVEIVGGLPSIQ
jgi:predicted helicase